MNKLSSSNEETEMIKEVITNFGENEINPIDWKNKSRGFDYSSYKTLFFQRKI